MIEKILTVQNRAGIHARPAAIIAQTSNKFESEITLTKDDATVNACFDADRLDLGRVGIIPNPDKMATVQGRILAEKMMEVNPKENWLLNGG